MYRALLTTVDGIHSKLDRHVLCPRKLKAAQMFVSCVDEVSMLRASVRWPMCLIRGSRGDAPQVDHYSGPSEDTLSN